MHAAALAASLVRAQVGQRAARYPQTHLRETGNGPVDTRWIEAERRADRTHSAIVAVTQQLE